MTIQTILVYFAWPTKRPGGHQSQLTMGQSLYAYSAVTAAIRKGRTRNLYFPTDEIRKVYLIGRVCQQCEPQFSTMRQMNLIKATRPMELLAQASRAFSR